MVLPYTLVIAILCLSQRNENLCSCKNLYMKVHRNFISKSYAPRYILMSEWLSKCGTPIPLSNKKETHTTDTTNNLDPPQEIILNENSQSQKS